MTEVIGDKHWWERIFGVNWRTTLTGFGTALMSLLAAFAALPFTLGDVSMIFPPEWKARIFTWSAVAAAILKVLNSMFTKDRQVSGNKMEGYTVANAHDVLKVIPSTVEPKVVEIVPPEPPKPTE